jgi:hypothetical protein
MSSNALSVIVDFVTFCRSNKQEGYTALIFSAKKGHTDCVNVLLENGADKEATDIVRDALFVPK